MRRRSLSKLDRKSLRSKTWSIYGNWTLSLLEIDWSWCLLFSRHIILILSILLLWHKSSLPSIVLILISIPLLRHKLLSRHHLRHRHEHWTHIHELHMRHHRHLLLEILKWHKKIRLRHLLHIRWNIHIHRRIHFESHKSILVLVLNITGMIFFVVKPWYKWFLANFEHFM